MSAEVLELVPNPWAICAACSDEVAHRTAAGQNMPCGCVAGVVSVCPTWDLFGGCQCSDEAKARQAELAAAEALQAALEQQVPGLLLLPAEVPGGDVAAFVEAFRNADRSAQVLTSDPAFRRVVDLRESEPEAAPPTPAAELGDDVLEQAGELHVPVLIALTVLIVAVIVGTALFVG